MVSRGKIISRGKCSALSRYFLLFFHVLFFFTSSKLKICELNINPKMESHLHNKQIIPKYYIYHLLHTINYCRNRNNDSCRIVSYYLPRCSLSSLRNEPIYLIIFFTQTEYHDTSKKVNAGKSCVDFHLIASPPRIR